MKMSHNGSTSTIPIPFPHFQKTDSTIDDGEIIIVEGGWQNLICPSATSGSGQYKILTGNASIF
jgi:hypothetical protein